MLFFVLLLHAVDDLSFPQTAMANGGQHRIPIPESVLSCLLYTSIMGSDRNSYSKTDLEATFMRMKEDHMRNGQLKPAYNVQIAVENYFIIHSYISNDRTDYNTLIPVIEKHKNAFGDILKETTADSGYCSEKNLLYLKKNHIASYIKLQDHEKRKTRAYKNDIGKYYNMEKRDSGDGKYYVCHDGRQLRHIRTEARKQEGYTQTFEVYGCADCSGCEHKARCLYKYCLLYTSIRSYSFLTL